MKVNHSGWSEDRGYFSYDIFIDEKRTDYAIHYVNGDIARQVSPFHEVTRDWNNDDDVYTEFGALFQFTDPNSQMVGRSFWTPVQMVQAAIDALDNNEHTPGNQVAFIEGVEIPSREKRSSIDEYIRNSEKRAMHRDIERNAKMKALGIRPPGEPWVR